MASFALREGAVTVDLSLGRDGTLAATLALRPNPADPECLALGLRAAAPQGEAWNRSLDAVLARFPPVLEIAYDPLHAIAPPGDSAPGRAPAALDRPEPAPP